MSAPISNTLREGAGESSQQSANCKSFGECAQKRKVQTMTTIGCMNVQEAA